MVDNTNNSPKQQFHNQTHTQTQDQNTTPKENQHNQTRQQSPMDYIYILSVQKLEK